MCIRDKLGAYIILVFWNTKNCLWWLAERSSLWCRSYSALWLRGVRLSTGWLKSPGSSHSRPHQSNGPAHLCLRWRLSSEGSWETTLTEETALKWAWGTVSKFLLTCMFWQSHLQWVRAEVGWQWQGLWWKETQRSDWSSACLWGECWRLSATKALLYCQSHPYQYACAQLCMYTGVLFYSADRQHFCTLKFQFESKQPVYHTFCTVRHCHVFTEKPLKQIIL